MVFTTKVAGGVGIGERSGGVEFGHALATEVVADVIAEKSASRFGIEKCLMIGSREIEVPIDVAGVAESQIQDLLRIVVSGCGEHLRFQRQPFHTADLSLLRNGSSGKAGWFIPTAGNCEVLMRGGGCGGSVMWICSSKACTSGSGCVWRGSTSQRPSSSGIHTSTI